MTYFEGGPRFCEVKAVNKAHIRQADWVIHTLQSCSHTCDPAITIYRRQRCTKIIKVS